MSTGKTLLSLCVFPHGICGPSLSAQDGDPVVPLVLTAEQHAELEGFLASSSSGYGPAPHGVAAPYMLVGPLADGVIDPNEYANRIHYSFADRQNPGAPFPRLDRIEPIEGSEENDLSLDLYLAHNDEYLFLGFDAQDEFLRLEENVDPFHNDSVGVYINADLHIGDWIPFRRDASAEGFVVIADLAGVARIVNGRARNIEPDDVAQNNRFSDDDYPRPVDTANPEPGEFYSAGLPDDDGWSLEFQIPLGTFDTGRDGGPLVPAKTGDVMLMNFAINDWDSLGRAFGSTHAMQWVVETDERAPYAGGENIWVVPLGLTPSVIGDFDRDGDYDADDIDAVSAAIRDGDQDRQLDFDRNGVINGEDRIQLISEIKHTVLGDSNLDGEFDSADLGAVFAAGQYEDAVAGNSGWAEGDWSGDGDFTSRDLVLAFQDGGYEQGPRPEQNAVPEPSSGALLVAALIGVASVSRSRGNRVLPSQ